VKLISHTEGVGKQGAGENTWSHAEEHKKNVLEKFSCLELPNLYYSPSSIESTRSSGKN
jgi:hypothetical protein